MTAAVPDYQAGPLTDEEKRWKHEWSLDWQIAENERLFPTNKDANYPVEDVDVKQVLQNAGVDVPPNPPTPSPAGQSMYTGPLVVEGENDVPPAPGEPTPRVPLPRDHPLTGDVEHGDQLPNTVVVGEDGDEKKPFDREATWEEICTLDVDELKENLRDLDQPVGGKKDELRERLLNALEDAAANAESQE